MLKAGFARLDITPPLGERIAGYFYERPADGILDPVEVNAIAVGNGTDTIVIAAVDFLGLSTSHSALIRKMISERTGINEDNIFVSCLHQHTAIFYTGADPSMNIQEFGDRDFVNLFTRKICDAAQAAIDDMSDAEVSYAMERTAEDISFIRRYLMDDGTVKTNPGRLNPRIVKPMGESDNNVRLVRFKREGAKDIALVNFSTHPDVVGGTKYSADWCGFVRRYVEADIADVSCIFVNGVQGDTNHIDHKYNSQPMTGYEQAEHMGRVIADTVVSVWDKTEVREGDRVCGGVATVYNRTRTDGEERYEECKAFCERYYASSGEEQKRIGALAISSAQRIVNIRTARIYRSVPVSMISFAGIVFVGFGGEPFTHYATAVREAVPDRLIIAACCTNGYEGYLPTKSAFAEGGYEAGSSEFSESLEDQCVEAAVALISRI